MSDRQSTRTKELISTLRIKSGLSGRKFAASLRVSHSCVSKWEHGNGHMRGDSKLTVADRIGKSITELDLYLDGHMELKDLLGAEIKSTPYETVVSTINELNTDETLALMRIVTNSLKPENIRFESEEKGIVYRHGLPIEEAYDILKGFIKCLVQFKYPYGYSLAEIAELTEEPSDIGLMNVVNKLLNGEKSNCNK